MGAPALRVIVAEDHTLVREGVVRVLEQGGCVVAAVAEDARELVRKAALYRPDVVIADIRLPPGYDDDGIRAALQIRAAAPEVSVIVLSQFLEDRYVLDLVDGRPGGVGYLLKEKIASPGVLVDAVRRVAAGGSALDPDVIERLVARKREGGPLGELTPRERDVLGLMAEGWSSGEAVRNGAGRGTARYADLQQARHAAVIGQPAPACARGAQVPAELIARACSDCGSGRGGGCGYRPAAAATRSSLLTMPGTCP